MAEKSNIMSVELTPVERMWIVRCLASQRQMLSRARQKEMPGSDIWHLRGREIDDLGELARRFEK